MRVCLCIVGVFSSLYSLVSYELEPKAAAFSLSN